MVHLDNMDRARPGFLSLVGDRMMRISRRRLLELTGSAAVLRFSGAVASPARPRFRIRTITAGIELASVAELERIRETIDVLVRMQADYESKGYAVQTLRLATQSLPEYLPDWQDSASIRALAKLDRLAEDHRILLALGPVITGNQYLPALARWADELIRTTTRTSFSISIASAGLGIHRDTIRSAAETIAALSRTEPGGQGNFRFTASACVPPGTPFFPAAYHAGENAFSIGLETPNLLDDVFAASAGLAEAEARLKNALQVALEPIEETGRQLARTTGFHYGGIDVSPAPGTDASIGQAIETLTGHPFGSASTLSACAVITGALKSLAVKTCGYSGLMLPVVEDRVLAARAAERRYGISELLLYSSVCGTGLDVVPLPGDTSPETLASIIGDVAALAVKLRKPLSARLFPIPGKKAGEMVAFDHPLLTGSVVMEPD
jgi:hypothetical protein